MARGVIVWLADKQTCQQDPIPVMHSGYLNDGVAEAQHQRHSYRMTEEGGFRREVTAKTQPDITQSVRAVISELIFVIIMGQCLGLF
ncbi:hypothetical protein ExPCM16_03225 [Escherichia coli]|nr:hypothetical protein ExPCM16_03225 [Escherichia coli]